MISRSALSESQIRNVTLSRFPTGDSVLRYELSQIEFDHIEIICRYHKVNMCKVAKFGIKYLAPTADRSKL